MILANARWVICLGLDVRVFETEQQQLNSTENDLDQLMTKFVFSACVVRKANK